jgi:hypothetical protein
MRIGATPDTNATSDCVSIHKLRLSARFSHKLGHASKHRCPAAPQEMAFSTSSNFHLPLLSERRAAD